MITLWLLGVWVHNPLRYDVIEQRNGLSNYFIHEYFGPIKAILVIPPIKNQILLKYMYEKVAKETRVKS